MKKNKQINEKQTNKQTNKLKETKAMTPTPQTWKEASTNKAITTKTKQTKNKIIIQLLTVRELVTLECGPTHVLQAPNTQTYYS